ncbi:adenosine receptor A3-like [Stylophora pistillata]|uniref:adenosine receptor A3-like n=1 Tax=Stylophora pistillata TaxID=50429 RepID=UPI000C04792A|nr:adenosine receptor A3-like [Stylophora pistillata]
MMNIATIYALRKVSSLPNTLKTLLLSLAVSDIGVGLLGQPLYFLTLVKWLQQNHPSCPIYRVFDLLSILFAKASFLGVVAISPDRFLAIHLHLRYQEFVTHRRVVVVLLSVWFSSAFVSLIAFAGFVSIQSVISFVLGSIGPLVTTVFYIQIYLIVRRHKNQIHALQVEQTEQTEEARKFASAIKTAVCVFCVHVVFLLCHLPLFVVFVASNVIVSSTAITKFFLYSMTLTFLNSSLNPVVYCWKIRHIRQAIMNIPRNMARVRN